MLFCCCTRRSWAEWSEPGRRHANVHGVAQNDNASRRLAFLATRRVLILHTGPRLLGRALSDTPLAICTGRAPPLSLSLSLYLPLSLSLSFSGHWGSIVCTKYKGLGGVFLGGRDQQGTCERCMEPAHTNAVVFRNKLV